MFVHRFMPLALLLLLALAGCSNLPLFSGDGSQSGTLVPTAGITPTQAFTGDAEQTPAVPDATMTAALEATGSLVRIWLPPEFDPDGDGPASALLKDRLEQFASENPDVRLDVRVKSLTGTGGLLEALTAAHVSAPLALPDLVLLPRPMLESAALKGLLTPYDGLTTRLDDPGWFPYAQQLARVETSIYGLPFAGDALVLAYRPAQTGITPNNLEEILSLGEVLLFPAADPQALFTLSTYVDAGGSLQSADGRPELDRAILTKVLEFVQRASSGGMMPSWLAQYSEDEQVWDAFIRDQYPMAITWASTFLETPPESSGEVVLKPIPAWDGTPFAVANGWSWALAGQDPTRRALSVRLAEFLLEKEFLASWTEAAGYLPPTEDALHGWQDATLRQAIERVSASAQLIPPADQVSSLGPALAQALVKVLKAESDPQSAAATAIDQIHEP